MTTIVVNMRKGCDDARIAKAKEQDAFVRVDRASMWGNPFRIGEDGSRETVIAKYREWLATEPDLLAQVHTLKDKVLGCWCHPSACHADYLAELADKSEHPHLTDALGYKWIFDGERIVCEGDDSEDGGYPCTSLDEAWGILSRDGYM